MEALPADWQNILRISPGDIDADNDDEVDNNEQMGLKFIKVNNANVMRTCVMNEAFFVAQCGCT